MWSQRLLGRQPSRGGEPGELQRILPCLAKYALTSLTAPASPPLNCSQQARAGTLYAPGLTYVPNTSSLPDSLFGGNGAAAAAAQAVAATAQVAPAPAVEPSAAPAAPPAVSLMSQDDEEAGPEAAQCTQESTCCWP